MNAIPAPILMVEDVTVNFDGFKALSNVNLSLTPGALRILIGPNGAGKSTLCDTIIGRVRATSGKQWLEIGMVVATDADLLLLDEPTAGMGPQDTQRTAQLILSLLGRHAVLVIDHDMSFVEALNGYVTVLHQGQILKEGTVAEIRADPEVTAVYLGRADDDEPAAA
jgi:ABC-type uncharacterized transport system ATPase subunit